jgi:hypothetical protein
VNESNTSTGCCACFANSPLKLDIVRIESFLLIVMMTYNQVEVRVDLCHIQLAVLKTDTLKSD